MSVSGDTTHVLQWKQSTWLWLCWLETNVYLCEVITSLWCRVDGDPLTYYDREQGYIPFLQCHLWHCSSSPSILWCHSLALLPLPPVDGWTSCCLISIRGQSHFIWVATHTLSLPSCHQHPPVGTDFIIMPDPCFIQWCPPPCLVSSPHCIGDGVPLGPILVRSVILSMILWIPLNSVVMTPFLLILTSYAIESFLLQISVDSALSSRLAQSCNFCAPLHMTSTLLASCASGSHDRSVHSS